MITGSSAFEVAACPARAALPGCHETGEAAEIGNVIHDFCRKVKNKPELRAEFLAEIKDAETRTRCAAINLDAALEGLRVDGQEVAFALDVQKRTCRLIGENINRRYAEHLAACGEAPLGKYEIPFTVDVLGWSTEFDCPVELDYKTGQYVGPVAEHGQRRVHAAGLQFYYGATSSIGSIAYIEDDGNVRLDAHEFDVFGSWETCDTLKAAVDAVDKVKELIATGGIPDVRPDREKQCRYCPAYNACPYWNNLIAGALGKLEEYKHSLEVLTDAQRGQAFDYVKDVLKVAEELSDKLRTVVLKRPLVVDDQYEFRAEDKKGRAWFDAAEARGKLIIMMGRLGMSQEEIDAEMTSLTKPGGTTPEVRKRKRLDVVNNKKKPKKEKAA